MWRPLAQTLRDEIEKRLAADEDWAASSLGQAFSALVDSGDISVRTMGAVTGLRHRSLYRWITSTSGQPSKGRRPKNFDETLRRFTVALRKADEVDAFAEVRQAYEDAIANGITNYKYTEASVVVLLKHYPNE